MRLSRIGLSFLAISWLQTEYRLPGTNRHDELAGRISVLDGQGGGNINSKQSTSVIELPPRPLDYAYRVKTFMFAIDIYRKKNFQVQRYSNWRWYRHEFFVRINIDRHQFWRAFDQEIGAQERGVAKCRDYATASNPREKTSNAADKLKLQSPLIRAGMALR